MIYVKFDDKNISTEMRLDPPPSGEEGFVSVSDDSLFGKRLVKLKNKVREFTDKEYAEEAEALSKKQKAIVVDNMIRSLLNASQHLALPDYYDGLPASEQKRIKTYRDALRAVKDQPGYPEKVTFPELPE
jgi:hypothetical protein